MDEYKKACEGVTTSVIIPFVTAVLAFFIGAFFHKCPWFFRWLGGEKNNPSCFQRDMMEIKKTTLQIANEWIEMTKLIQKNHEDQSNFASCLQSHLETNIEALGKSITVSLEEEFLRNDQRFVKMKRTIEGMQEEIISMKNFLQTFVQKSSISKSSEEKKCKALDDNFVQTEKDGKKRIRDTHTKIAINAEHDASKLISMIRKCLADVMKDTQLHLSIDREEENRELQIILTRLAEDREDIKKTIMQAFSIAADQAKRGFDQFGHIGQDAMRYIAVLNENTNKMLKLKLKGTDDRLKEILNVVNRQIFDVDAVRATLENIDGQFDEIFQRVEIGCQKNTEHCEEIALSLERTSNNWVTAISDLENVTKDLSDETRKIKEMLKGINLKQTDKQRDNTEKNEIIQYDSLASDTPRDVRILSQKQRNTIFIYSMIQSCWENMTCMNSRVENGCRSICKLIEGLERKLRLLNESVERLDVNIRNVNLENFDNRVVCSECPDAGTEVFVDNLMESNVGNAGDGQTQREIVENIESKLADKTLTEKLQDVIATDKEVKIIELILRKVHEKRNAKDGELL